MSEKTIQIESRYDRIVLDFSRLQSRVEVTPLDKAQWDALHKAEVAMYGSENWDRSYTAVFHREDAIEAAILWTFVQNPVDDALESGELTFVSDELRNSTIAKRVARAIAVAAFGPEFLMK